MQKIEDVEIYKDMMCPFCEHYKTNFEECEIRKCVDGTIKCCEYKKEKRKWEKKQKLVRFGEH